MPNYKDFQRTKLQRIAVFLKENNIPYVLHKKHRFGCEDLFVPSLKLAIKIEGKDDALFFKRYKKKTFPIFIRKQENIAYIEMKVINTITRAMNNLHIKHQKQITKTK